MQWGGPFNLNISVRAPDQGCSAAAAAAAAATSAAAAASTAIHAAAAADNSKVFWLSVRAEVLLNWIRSLESCTLELEQFLQKIVIFCEKRLEVIVK